ncbi:MAG: Wzz/FepE/Etk N-terminal domain-containing protein [Methanothrix sp.]|nr:Wzz/FepE/Etk N-terminal domain-containing protein [Methanothrix sp.]
MDDEIDLRDIFNVLWKGRRLVGGIFIASVIIATIISFVIPQVFQISGIVALGNFGEPIYTSQGAALDFMQSDEFLLDVFDGMNLNLTSSKFAELKDNIKIEPVKDTESLLLISIESKNKSQGIEIVDGIISHFANKSEDRYDKQIQILSDQLAVTNENLNVLEADINQTRDVLTSIEGASGASSEGNEMRVSRTLDYLQAEESRRSALQDRYLDLNKQITLARHLDVVQKPTEPITPIWPKKMLIVAVAGMLGLMIGVFAVFLRASLGKRTD